MAKLTEYEEKIRLKQARSRDALNSALKKAHTEPFNFDYDLDTRWASVTAFTAFVYRGRRYRLSIVEDPE